MLHLMWKLSNCCAGYCLGFIWLFMWDYACHHPQSHFHPGTCNLIHHAHLFRHLIWLLVLRG